MKLNFTTWNIFIQDGSIDELEVGENFTDVLYIENLEDIKLQEFSKTKFKHIKNNKYEMLFYVFKVVDSMVFVEIEGLYFVIFGNDFRFEEECYYRLKASLIHDIWACFCEEEYMPSYLFLKGKICSIFNDIAKLKQLNNKTWTNKGVEPKYEVKLKRTNCWKDNINYPYRSGNYLVEIEISNLEIERKKFLQVLHNIVKIIDIV